MYKLLKFGVRRIADHACIPDAENNVDWKRYQEWLAAGNAPEPADPDPVLNPTVVTMRQARLALHGAGLLAKVNSAVAALGGEAAIEWEYSTTVSREFLVLSLVLSNQQIDDLFLAASKI